MKKPTKFAKRNGTELTYLLADKVGRKYSELVQVSAKAEALLWAAVIYGDHGIFVDTVTGPDREAAHELVDAKLARWVDAGKHNLAAIHG